MSFKYQRAMCPHEPTVTSGFHNENAHSGSILWKRKCIYLWKYLLSAVVAEVCGWSHRVCHVCMVRVSLCGLILFYPEGKHSTHMQRLDGCKAALCSDRMKPQKGEQAKIWPGMKWKWQKGEVEKRWEVTYVWGKKEWRGRNISLDHKRRNNLAQLTLFSFISDRWAWSADCCTHDGNVSERYS